MSYVGMPIVVCKKSDYNRCGLMKLVPNPLSEADMKKIKEFERLVKRKIIPDDSEASKKALDEDIKEIRDLYKLIMNKMFARKALLSATQFDEWDDVKKYGTMLEYLMECSCRVGIEKDTKDEIEQAYPSIRSKYGGLYYLMSEDGKHYYVLVMCLKSGVTTLEGKKEKLTARWFKGLPKEFIDYVDIKGKITKSKRAEMHNNAIFWLIKHADNNEKYRKRIIEKYEYYRKKYENAVRRIKNYSNRSRDEQEIIDEFIENNFIIKDLNKTAMESLMKEKRVSVKPREEKPKEEKPKEEKPKEEKPKEEKPKEEKPKEEKPKKIDELKKTASDLMSELNKYELSDDDREERDRIIKNIYNVKERALKDKINKLKKIINKYKEKTIEKPTEEKPTEEKPTEEKPTEEKPTEEKPTEEDYLSEELKKDIYDKVKDIYLRKMRIYIRERAAGKSNDYKKVLADKLKTIIYSDKDKDKIREYIEYLMRAESTRSLKTMKDYKSFISP